MDGIFGSDTRFDQRSGALFEEERVSFRPLEQQPFERLEVGVLAQKCFQQMLSAFSWQRINSELTIIGLAAPAVPIFGPIIDEKQQAANEVGWHDVAPLGRQRMSS